MMGPITPPSQAASKSNKHVPPLTNTQQSDLGHPPAGGRALAAPLHHLRGRRRRLRWRCAQFKGRPQLHLEISAVRPHMKVAARNKRWQWPFAFSLTGGWGLMEITLFSFSLKWGSFFFKSEPNACKNKGHESPTYFISGASERSSTPAQTATPAS